MTKAKAIRSAAEVAADGKRTGRPPIDGVTRSYPVLVRITPAERELWGRKAKAAGLPLAAWIAKPRRDRTRREVGGRG